MDGIRKWAAGLSAWKYVLLVAGVGLLLLLMPSGGGASEGGDGEEERLEALLGCIEGVGEVRLLLSDEGAAVVCRGADNVGVRWEICQALRCYTGFGTERIGIFKME